MATVKNNLTENLYLIWSWIANYYATSIYKDWLKFDQLFLREKQPKKKSDYNHKEIIIEIKIFYRDARKTKVSLKAFDIQMVVHNL